MSDRPPVPGSPRAARADASDAMVGAGGLLLVAAVVALAGLWWGVGLLGLLLAALGLFRAA